MQRVIFLVVALCAFAYGQSGYNAWQSQPWRQQREPVREYWPQQRPSAFSPETQQNFWPQEPQPYYYEQRVQVGPQQWPGQQQPQTQMFYFDQQPQFQQQQPGGYDAQTRFDQQEYKAIAKLTGDTVNGNVTFTQYGDGPVRIQGTVVGLPKGSVGFHVHDKGDLTGGCATLMGHFNPDKKMHGAPEDHDRHAGDLGNIQFGYDNVARIDINDSLISLHGKYGIVGRGLVVHANVDDLGKTNHPDSKTTGNAGGRVACGVIGILENSSAILHISNLLIVSCFFVLSKFI